MLNSFQKFIQQEQLFLPKEKILLAISGGMDSMVMAHLFWSAGLRFGIAHCNFQLRGKASDEDEAWVKSMAAQWQVAFHNTCFDTKEKAIKQKKNIQLMARELRYAWFERILQAFDYQYIATAHHLNDSLETVLYNLAKGGGIRALHGIPVKQGNIIRPLSFTSREMIEQYAKKHQISYREDASNQSNKYDRNLIRHQITPALKKINPSLEKTFRHTLSIIRETEYLFDWAVAAFRERLLTYKDGVTLIRKKGLTSEKAKTTILFELTKDYGFHRDQIGQILAAINHIGAQFYSSSHQLLIDRRFLMIKEKQITEALYLEINTISKMVTLPNGRLSFQILSQKPDSLNQPRNIALIDFDKISLPITVRNWRPGDRFQPIGMKGQTKKIKDYLRDQKISRFDKNEILIMESAGKILWVLGLRTDERFKVDSKTRKILKIELE